MKLQKWLDNFFGDDKNYNSGDEEYDDKIATSVLFIELAGADFNVTPEEEKKIFSSLQNFFNMPGEEVEEIIKIAKEKRSERQDIWLFTNQIKQNYNRERKIKIVELLWQLVYADGSMDKYEEALMREISNLLGLTHGEMIEAKIKVKPK